MSVFSDNHTKNDDPYVAQRKLSWKGFSSEIRAQMWMELSGAAQRKQSHSEGYFELLRERLYFIDASGKKIRNHIDIEPEEFEAIEKDVIRSFDGELTEYRSEEEYARLTDVLLVFSMEKPELGYCQGMNFICALMLQHLTPEDAFWLMLTLVDDILPEEFFGRSLRGYRIEQGVFQDLVDVHAQQLREMIPEQDRLSLFLNFIAVQWMVQLFVHELPISVVLRVWDVLFANGFDIVHRVSLSLLRNYLSSVSMHSEMFAQSFMHHVKAHANADVVLSMAEQIEIDVNQLRELRRVYTDRIVLCEEDYYASRAVIFDGQLDGPFTGGRNIS